MANDLYFNGLAKSLENKLLSADQLKKIVYLGNADDIAKILFDTFDLPSKEIRNFDEINFILNEAKTNFLKFLKSNSPNNNIYKFFVLPVDYHNIECAYLGLKQIISAEKTHLGGGQFSENFVKEKLLANEYDAFSVPMFECLTKLDALFDLAPPSNLVVDLLFKKALKAELQQIAAENKFLKSIVSLQLQAENILLALRLKDHKLFCELALTKSGDDDFFKDLCSKTNEQIFIKWSFCNLFAVVKLAIKCLESGMGVGKFQEFVRAYPIKYLKEHKSETTSCAPFLFYCFKFQNLLEDLRLIVNAKNCGESESQILKLLRGSDD